jgi:hypothetical protein
MQTLKRIPYLASIALLAYMPFHIFLSQSLSLTTGGLDIWKVGKDVVLILACLFTICLVYMQGRGNRAFGWLLGGTFLYGLLHLGLWTVNADIYDRSAMIGIIYNMRLPLAAILGFGAVLLLPKFVFSSAIKVIMIISTIVATLGIVQFFLPGDILTHFGYGLDRGARPAFYIDDNQNLPPRIMSTLREPNVLGAYLILPASALLALCLRPYENRRKLLLAGALGVHVIAVGLTFSRSAWLGLTLALLLVLYWQYSETVWKYAKRLWPVLVSLVLLAGVATFAMRNTYFFQHYIIHGNSEEQVQDLDSNDYHILFIKQGLEGIRDEPLGHGPGTAGLASIQNPEGSFLTENYYVQIGYEVGVLGLALFIALNVWLYRLIRRSGSDWAFVLLASFWAYVLTNMLLHTWANEAVSLQWWLLAGMASALAVKSSRNLPTKR